MDPPKGGRVRPRPVMLRPLAIANSTHAPPKPVKPAEDGPRAARWWETAYRMPSTTTLGAHLSAVASTAMAPPTEALGAGAPFRVRLVFFRRISCIRMCRWRLAERHVPRWVWVGVRPGSCQPGLFWGCKLVPPPLPPPPSFVHRPPCSRRTLTARRHDDCVCRRSFGSWRGCEHRSAHRPLLAAVTICRQLRSRRPSPVPGPRGLGCQPHRRWRRNSAANTHGGCRWCVQGAGGTVRGPTRPERPGRLWHRQRGGGGGGGGCACRDLPRDTGMVLFWAAHSAARAGWWTGRVPCRGPAPGRGDRCVHRCGRWCGRGRERWWSRVSPKGPAPPEAPSRGP